MKTVLQQSVPDIRIQTMNEANVHRNGSFVLYWMTASRRLNCNFALDRALEHCRSLDRPVRQAALAGGTALRRALGVR